ncbi:DNA translocase FtsK [Candidatus Kaiserbacteria bacterium]|nr:DNA translocase FtsK [Candidatus Kaiserbacteria bacterium]
MARRKKQYRKNYFEDVAPAARQAIAAVVFVVLGIFFILSSFDLAGVAGEMAHTALRYLFGVGFFLAPVACALYVFILLHPREEEQVGIAKIAGVALLFFALLGLLSLYDAHAGGIGGMIFAKPFSFLLGPLASSVILSALALIGLFLTFNIGITVPRFGIKEKTDEPAAPPTIIDEPIIHQAIPSSEEEAPEQRGNIPEAVDTASRKRGAFAVSHFYGPYDPPPLSLLEKDKGTARVGDVKASANIIKRTLQNFNIEVEMDEVSIGPSVTRYALKPAEGVRISKIVGLQNNLELALAAHPVRIEAPIPGKSLVGIEVPNTTKSMVGLASLLSSPEYTDSPKPLLVALGKDIAGSAIFANVAQMPHILIAGTTGSGKSVTIHSLVTSLLFRNSPEQLRFIMVDPKRVELTLYNGIPHLLTPVITDAKKTILALKWAAKEMERRYDILQSERVRDLASYHETVYFPARDATRKGQGPEDMPEPLPYIVIIIDELADIMQAYPRELEACVVRLAQMSRAVGIHLMLSTQRPSVNVITGLIKANIPTRLALQVASQIDSRTILDQTGAEKLLGAGDMLYLSGEMSKPKRIQSAFLSEGEVKKVTEYLRKQHDAQELDAIDLSGAGKDPVEADAFFSSVADDDDDDLYEEAKGLVTEAGKASTSYLQRRLRIGYSRAARLVDLLEERGVIGPADGGRPREVLRAPGEDDAGNTV